MYVMNRTSLSLRGYNNTEEMESTLLLHPYTGIEVLVVVAVVACPGA